MNRFTILMLFCSSLSFAQENTDRLRPGVQVSSVFSETNDHGISPALTLSYHRFMFTVGPRFTYNQMFNDFSYYDSYNQLILDASLRYYILPEEKRVRPFAQLAMAYKYRHATSEQDYRAGDMYLYGPLFDHDFRGLWDSKTNSVSLFAGVGVDVRIWKGLSAFASAGVGTMISKSKTVITNVGTGADEYSERSQQNGRFTWIASAGLGYRF